MFVGNPRSQGAQRNCAINQRISTGAFGGIGFNQVAGSNGAITIQQDAFSYHVFSGATIQDVGAHVSSAVTGKLSAYLMARDGVTFLASIDGVAKSVTVNFADSDEPMPAGAECKIGDLGDLATTGYGYQDGVALVAIWDTNLSQAEANFWTANPWQLFAPQQIYIPTPAAAVVPTLSASTYVPGSMTSTGWRPQITAS